MTRSHQIIRHRAKPLIPIAVGLGLFSSVCFAEVQCLGEVSNLSLQLNAVGTVTLSLSDGPAFTYLCDVDGSRNGVSANVCRTMYSTLMAAKLAGKRVSIRFYDHASCSAIPAWTNAGTLGWTILLVD